MSNSPITGRTFSATTVSDVEKRLNRLDVKDAKRTAQLAAIMIDLAYSVEAWRSSGVTVKDTSKRLASLRGETGARAELRAAMPNTSDKVQQAMINIAKIIRKGRSEADHDNLDLIKAIIADVNYLMAGKGRRNMTVGDLADMASEYRDMAGFSAGLAALREMVTEAEAASKITEATVEVDPQTLINNALAILNAEALRGATGLNLDAINAQLIKINRANKAVTAAA
jgi:hypothetical protein